MPFPTLADATDLASWANWRDAQERLPQLLRRLILSTASGVSRIHFAAGEGVQQGGWDGMAIVTSGNAFVPDGTSVWETGVNRDPKRKADDDHRKRSQNPLDTNPAEAAFIFVTPRRWSAKHHWEAEKRKDGLWREVRAYDADDLETWLELSPGVHTWITGQLGKGSDAAQDLGTFWEDWSEATRPPLSVDLVIAGRDQAVEQVQQWLSGPPGVFALQADSRDEALAFLAASVQRLPETQRESLSVRAVVIAHLPTWRWATASQCPLLLVPLFNDADAAKAVRGGHHVFVPLGRESSALPGVVELGRLHRAAAKDALLKMGLSDARADTLATVARCSLLSLRRKLAISPALQQPAWARPDEVHAILPAMFAGGWDENRTADRDVLAALAGCPYEDIARYLTRWANEADPPVRRIGTNWLLVSREDTWPLLSRFVTADDLQRFQETLLRVFGTSDPALELPEEERWMAGALGRSRPHSDLLREGLADTLALIGTRGEQTLLTAGGTGQDHANRIVQQRLVQANADQSGDLWSSISDVLPLFAEAAPDVFLEAVDAGLSGDSPVLPKLFKDTEGSASLFARSPHTGLLWALEGLAWSPDHVARAVQLLARLVRLDPGGKQGNRPNRSLRNIFLFWHPHTAASLEQRLQVLDMLRVREPDVAWKLLLALLPQFHDVALPTHAPRWREWKPEGELVVSLNDLGRATREVASLLLEDVGRDAERWCDLIEAIDNLPSDTQDAVIERLNSLDVGAVGELGRDAVWDAIRTVVSRHQRHPDAQWALLPEQVARLAEVYRRFEPEDLVKKHAWLFAAHPALPDADHGNWREYRQTLSEARTEAAQAIFGTGGLPALLALTSAVAEAGELGWIVGRNDLLGSQAADVISLLASSAQPERALAAGYVARQYTARGWEWAEALLMSDAPQWTADQRASFLASIPSSARTWGWAERLGAETERTYWSRFRSFHLEEPEQYASAVVKLIEHGRPYAAIDLLGHYADPATSAPDPQLVMEVLEHAAATAAADHVDASMLAHHVAEFLDYLERSGVVEEPHLARLEWVYLPLLRGRKALLLGRELARNPEFFVEVVSWVFRAENEGQSELSEEQRVRATLGFHLLKSWRSMPGCSDNGSIDAQTLNAWIDRARALLASRGRSAIGDQFIGYMLRHSPTDDDGAWPHRVIRDVIERVASEHLELGIDVEVHNSRGPTWRDPVQGGEQEREIAKTYLSHAQVVSSRWPRTAAMLRRVADSYGIEARQHDIDAELTEDLWR